MTVHGYVPHKPLTTGELRAIKQLTECSLPARMIGPLIGRSWHSIGCMRRRYSLKLPPLKNLLSFHVSDGCHDALAASADRYTVPVSTIARSCLELLARGHAPVAVHVLAPAAVPVRSAPLATAFQVALAARL
jgi:hypothetical protein